MRHKRLLLLLALSVLLNASSAAASEEGLSLQAKSIQFETADRIVHASLTSSAQFDIAWHIEGGELPSSLFAATDSTFYYKLAGIRAAILPSGETAEPHANAQEVHIPLPIGIHTDGSIITSSVNGHKWTYIPSKGTRFLPNSLQTDLAGHLYIQDDHGGWYSLHSDTGKLRYMLQLEPEDLGTDIRLFRCRVAPSGDAVCASSLLGMVGIRERSTAPRVFINGLEQFYAQRPLILNGTTLVPLRGIFEQLGATVKWNAIDHSIKASKSGKTIKIIVGSKQAIVGNDPITLSNAPLILNGTTFVPLRFISESLGAIVVWESPTTAIQIVS
ncbi:copper amine oxidase N-terminal domain-containing protein [Paenibacillus albus]|uniref:Copper amine oxidase N-terminal domain-containing protein n=1 Tax=Paenibacillus albus TaxID=2495582 RepID=A0A3Q8X3F2_9BACL|nr:copper amine oxidase N-terminal domain-containing protein [Paenibacillus albus]AZN39579.1 copper amine oxidase N-terminal domain-containing protein [Paenibacillus albus]